VSGIGSIQSPGIVHRLDKDTSGALAIAKIDHAHQHLQVQIQAKTAQWVDVFFVPTTRTIPSELGLLGRIAQHPCLLEPFRNQPTSEEVRIFLLKLCQVQEDFYDNSEGMKLLLLMMNSPSFGF
jgi:hypothetical protein